MSSKDHNINFKLMRDRILSEQNGKEFWRSMEELTDSDELHEFVSREFPRHAEVWDDPVERRTFLKLMGASLALAGLSGCIYQPPEQIVPYVNQPNEVVPGKPLYYATAMLMNGVAQGLLARSTEGRPTKIEGNPEHPASLGATDRFAQASLLTMYDPDRSQSVLYRGEGSSWDVFLNSVQPGKEGLKFELTEQKKKQGAGLRILTETVTSPTTAFQLQEILKEFPQAKWYSYLPTGRSNARKGSIMAFGQAVNIVYKFDQARRVLALDSDFFTDMSGSLRYTRDFMKRREPDEEMNRFYSIESILSLTGAKADHRLALRPSEIEGFARAVAKELGVSGVQSNPLDETKTKWVKAIAKDLQEHKGKSIVIAGESQPPIVHALAHAMNDTLGNVGKTVIYTDSIVSSQDPSKTQIEGLKELALDMNAGKVELLAIIGGNPVYNAPVDFKFQEAMDKVKFRVHLGLYTNETSEHCHWHINQAHFLEMWGDARAFDGTITFIQPLIEPLYGGKSTHEFLDVFTADPNRQTRKGYDILRAYWQTQKLPTSKEQAAILAEGEKGRKGEGEKKAETPKAETAKPTETPKPSATTTTTSTPRPAASPAVTPVATTTAAAPSAADFETSWRRVIHDGFIAGTALPAKTVSLKTDWISQAPVQAATGFEIVFRPGLNIGDGRFANNGWLQELPEPLTSITWDNAVMMSLQTAKDLGLTREDGYKGGTNQVGTVNIESQGNKIERAPIWILPGMPDKVLLLPLGYGRTRAGRVGNGVGFNAYKIRTSNAPWFGTATVSNAGEKYDIASTQLHFYMENRDLVRTRDLHEYMKDPKGKGDGSEEFKKDSIYNYEDRDRVYSNEYKWGMTIDLNSCMGCNACIVACQSENNIPVVGKEQVSRSREMHWLRVDTYFGDKPEDPKGPYFMPVPCQQCEQAPCEPVCPVHATVHTPEGLNDMVYNRCVGTRYCSNNCPYKVRRFNFLLYQDWNTPQYHLMRNPEVSVRSRGVMEKCTYCVQRIQNAKIEAQKDDRSLRDGEVVTACQAVCPAQAISFGDMNDATSVIARKKKEKRNYTILADLNTQPRTSYLAGIKNPNAELDKALGKEKKAETHGAEGH
jgi:molybdopterin-containing oxidoreductase family iron-sulfur binding subunit